MIRVVSRRVNRVPPSPKRAIIAILANDWLNSGDVDDDAFEAKPISVRCSIALHVEKR